MTHLYIGVCLVFTGCLTDNSSKENNGFHLVFEEVLTDLKKETSSYQLFLEIQGVKPLSVLSKKLVSEFGDDSRTELISHLEKKDTIGYQLLLVSKIRKKYYHSHYHASSIYPQLKFLSETDKDSVSLELFVTCDNDDIPVVIRSSLFKSLIKSSKGSFSFKVSDSIFSRIKTIPIDIDLGEGIIHSSFLKDEIK